MLSISPFPVSTSQVTSRRAQSCPQRMPPPTPTMILLDCKRSSRVAFDVVGPDYDCVSGERPELHRPYGVPPKTLRVREGAVYGIMRNLSPTLAH